MKPLGKLSRCVVLAQIGAQDLPGFPGNGHLGAGEVADRRTGLHRLSLHFPEQPGGEQLDQTQLLGIPQLPQFVQRRLNGGRSRGQIQAAVGVQMLHDLLRADLTLLKERIGLPGQRIQIKKQLDPLIETSGIAIFLLGLLCPHSHIPLREKGKLAVIQRHLTASLLTEIQQEDIVCLGLRQRPDLGINPVEGENHTFPQGEQPQAAVFRSTERHHGGFPVGTDLHAAGETSGIKEL